MIYLNDYRSYNTNVFTSRYKPNDYVRFIDNYDNIIRGWIIEARFSVKEIYYAIQQDSNSSVYNIYDDVEQKSIIGLVNED